jgi:hypothetical protein
MSCVELSSVQFSSVLFSSVQFSSVQFSSVEYNFRPTFIRRVRPGVGHPSGAHGQIFLFHSSDDNFLFFHCDGPNMARERVCNLYFSLTVVRVEDDSQPHIALSSETKIPFSSPLTARRDCD